MGKFTKYFFAIVLIISTYLTASAQTYNIRVEFNTNVRAEPSLDGARLETVPAGTVIEVLNLVNRWFRVNRQDGSWMASWVPHERVSGAQTVADNCCGIDRLCQQEHEWIDGYWAFQRGQCSAPVPISQTPEPVSQTPTQANVDNCCGIDRICQQEHEWIDGYWAFQRGQCGAPTATADGSGINNCCSSGWSCQGEHESIYGNWAFSHNRCTPRPDLPPAHFFQGSRDHGHIRIVELTAGFTALANRGFELLRVHAPNWYNYVNNAITELREVHEGPSGVFGASGKAVYHHAPTTFAQ